MNEILNWAILFGKIWVIVQIIGYAFALVLTVAVIVIILKALKERR